jgi:hypothetical protein
MTKFPEWKEFYVEAQIETDPCQFPLKVSRALVAIADRLTAGFDSISSEEKEALKDAVSTLKKLRERRESKKVVA